MDELPSSESPAEGDSLDQRLTLRTAPSFDIYSSSEGFGDGTNDTEEVLLRTITIGQMIGALDSGEFSFGKKEMDLIEEEEESEKDELSGSRKSGVEEEVEPASPPMYLAAGLGVDGTGFGFDSFPIDDLCLPNLDGSGDVEEHYKRMIDEYPCHPLILRNYAQILQSKGDLRGAEEYFLRATLADPNNGEILVQYARLVWDLHRDKQRALEYFERAAQAPPPDSQVLAAYASFLWEIEEEEDDDDDGKHDTNSKVQNENNEQNSKFVSPPKQDDQPAGLSLNPAARQEIDAADFTASNYGKGADIKDYFRKMIDENPSNPLFLKSYAQFLIQSKKDLQAAEKCYSRAILVNPGDGEMISEYAKLEWQLHHDWRKALSYFEQAVKATPEDSNVLAAYACFLWETEDVEAEISE
ncbi:uncharacterized protein LOC114749064 [Neltuma alba]|uniref:uncharacterized protein LOC114749064 n=1 Tax=Neltuma alba TaxID=207710 RepID=UPI0010A59D8A|nr:uncharacterized protein LOC114749064 [Prosopis alba]